MTAWKACAIVPSSALHSLAVGVGAARSQRPTYGICARWVTTAIYRLEYSKTQRAGVTADSTPDKPILGRSAEALAAWLVAAGIGEGAIFRHIWKGRVGPALLPGSVAGIVKRRARLAGLEGDFGAHSLRSGFARAGGVPTPLHARSDY